MKSHNAHMTTEHAREMQLKSATARRKNAQARAEIRKIIKTSTIEELLARYQLDTNLTQSQRNEIQQHVLTQMISTKYSEELRHKHAVERLLLKHELNELSAEHVAALKQESNQIDDTLSEELGLTL